MKLLVHKQANPTGFIRFIPVDQGLCTTFEFTQNGCHGGAKMREPPARGRWGRSFEAASDLTDSHRRQHRGHPFISSLRNSVSVRVLATSFASNPARRA